MKALKVKVKPPTAVEKTNGTFRLKADNQHTEDLALLAKGDPKVDDLAGVVAACSKGSGRWKKGCDINRLGHKNAPTC